MPFVSRRSIRCLISCCAVSLLWSSLAAAQSVPLQPFAQQVRRLEDALNYIGQPLPALGHAEINRALAAEDETRAVARIQEVLDQYVLAEVDINAESRVKVRPGKAKPELVEGGVRMFLVKVLNGAGVTAPLVVESPNSGPTSLRSRGEKEPAMELTQEHVKERWANLEMYDDPPMAKRLSGLGVEYRILQVYSRDVGQRSARSPSTSARARRTSVFEMTSLCCSTSDRRTRSFRVKDENGMPTIASFRSRICKAASTPTPPNASRPTFPSSLRFRAERGAAPGRLLHDCQGTQDIGFRNDILVLFNIGPAHPIKFRVKDENGMPTIASFTIKDLQGRLYPNPSKRLAPDFPFQPQVYRADGEEVRLPDGYYGRLLTMGDPSSTPAQRNCPSTKAPPRNFPSSFNAGSTRRSTVGGRAITTSMRPGARTTRTRPKAFSRGT